MQTFPSDFKLLQLVTELLIVAKTFDRLKSVVTLHRSFSNKVIISATGFKTEVRAPLFTLKSKYFTRSISIAYKNIVEFCFILFFWMFYRTKLKQILVFSVADFQSYQLKNITILPCCSFCRIVCFVKHFLFLFGWIILNQDQKY